MKAAKQVRAEAIDPAPVPRRTSRPKWLDPRVIGGLILVIVAIVVGAKVVGSSSRTTPIWEANRNLAAGTVLVAADLIAVDVNLGAEAGHYLAAGTGSLVILGRTLGTPVQVGELLPLSAIQDTPAGRVVVVAVGADQMPPGVVHGSKIDLYLTISSAGAAGKTSQIAKSITVQSVVAPASGGLSGASSSDFQLSVLLDPTVADNLVRTLPQGKAIVVLVTGR